MPRLAAPTRPRTSPSSDTPKEKKFRKKVDSRIFMTMRTGKTKPMINMIDPTIRKWTGFISLIIYIASKLHGVLAPVRTPAEPPRRTGP